MANNSGSNQPTDPFGGPPNRRSATSLVVAVFAVALFAVLRLSNGGIGNLLGGAAQPVATTPSGQPVAEVATEQATSDNTPAALAAVRPTATARPTQTPKSNSAAKATATPRPTQTPQPSSANQARPSIPPRPSPTPTPPPTPPRVAQISDLAAVALAN